MSNEKIWRIEQHTLAKHELLRKYLRAWFPILTIGGYNKRVIFLDGFAGPGIYAGGEPGSPIVALEALVNHSVLSSLTGTEFVFIFIETELERFKSLVRELDIFWDQLDGGQPSNVKVYTYNDEFTRVVQQIASSVGIQNQLAPTFAFVDPFGWSGVPLSVICELLSSDKCEVLFNFMYDSVSRFVTDERPGVARHFADLFGTDEAEYRRVAELQGEDRKGFLRDLYLQQLKTVGDFRFVRSFEVLDVDRGRTAYLLMFGTRSLKGLEVMKNAMWDLDPIAGVKFSGFAGDQMMLFAPEPDLRPLRTAILTHFTGQTVSIEDIESYVIVETDYKKSQYKSQLKALEEYGSIQCVSGRNRRGTYPPGTMLYFPPALFH